ncbi:MAG: c-type cytochrome biogenesis protein CcmI [Gammaproteobacteria bacterium]
MSLIFWSVASMLMLYAVLLVLYPLRKNIRASSSDAKSQNIAVARQRMAELDALLKAGILSRRDYAAQSDELEVSLGLDLKPGAGGCREKSSGRWIAYALTPAIPLVAVTLYFQLGHPDAVDRRFEDMKAHAGRQDTTASIEEMVARLDDRLQQTPGDLDGWLMLARSYQYLKQFGKAADAYSHALALKPDQPEIMLHYADVLAMQNDGRLSGKPAQLVFKALQYLPDDSMGLWLAGMAKAEDGDYGSALDYWLRLEKLLPAGSASQPELLELINFAKAKLAGALPDSVKNAEPAGLTVTVRLAPGIKEKADPEDTVFIYASPMSGSPMPLAIVRKRVKDLPTTVTLGDGQAMSPARKLSDFSEVRLTARVSPMESAIPNTGDLIGVVMQVGVYEAYPVELVIADEIE